MKMIIEISGGCITNIVSTQECSIYLVDHDNIKRSGLLDEGELEAAREAIQPDRITYEGDHVATPGASATPEFDACLEEALSEYTDRPCLSDGGFTNYNQFDERLVEAG